MIDDYSEGFSSISISMDWNMYYNVLHSNKTSDSLRKLSAELILDPP